nr:hypothetical protein Iba_chr12cCG11630 [Ipomoea batatas]
MASHVQSDASSKRTVTAGVPSAPPGLLKYVDGTYACPSSPAAPANDFAPADDSVVAAWIQQDRRDAMEAGCGRRSSAACNPLLGFQVSRSPHGRGLMSEPPYGHGRVVEPLWTMPRSRALMAKAPWSRPHGKSLALGPSGSSTGLNLGAPDQLESSMLCFFGLICSIYNIFINDNSIKASI